MATRPPRVRAPVDLSGLGGRITGLLVVACRSSVRIRFLFSPSVRWHPRRGQPYLASASPELPPLRLARGGSRGDSSIRTETGTPSVVASRHIVATRCDGYRPPSIAATVARETFAAIARSHCVMPRAIRSRFSVRLIFSAALDMAERYIFHDIESRLSRLRM